MKKLIPLKITFKELFKKLKIDDKNYEEFKNNVNNIFIRDENGDLVKILGFVKKRGKIQKTTLENGLVIKTSERHILISSRGQETVKLAEDILVNGEFIPIIEKEISTYSKDLYDISISAPHLYQTPNGIIHHNTTCAKFIPKILELPFLYINASEENGIEVLRSKIKDFATSQTIDGKLKIVIIDESDGTTPAFQAACRNVIESTYKTTRYIFTANYPEKIIAPLHSRLKEIVFGDIDEKLVLKRVLEILKLEGIEVPKEQGSNLVTLIKKFHPDIRRILNHLQSFSNSGKLEIVFDNIVSIDMFEQIHSSIKNKKFSEIRNIIRNNKVDTDGIIKKFFDEILDSNSVYFKDLNEGKRAELILISCDALYRSNFVIDKSINFAAYCIELSRAGI